MKIKGMTPGQLIAYVQSKVIRRSHPPDQVQNASPADLGSGAKSIVAEETLPAGHLPLPPRMPDGLIPIGYRRTPVETETCAPAKADSPPSLIPVPQDDADGLDVEVGAKLGSWLMYGMLPIKRTDETRQLFEEMEQVSWRGSVEEICKFVTGKEAVLKSLGFASEPLEKLLNYAHGRQSVVPPPCFVSQTLEIIIKDLRQRDKTDPLIKKVCQQIIALKSVRSSVDLGVWLGGINGLELEEAEVDLAVLKGAILEIRQHLERIEAK